VHIAFVYLVVLIDLVFYKIQGVIFVSKSIDPSILICDPLS